jgi:hypothetical protein
MDALLWIGHIFWFAFVAAGILVALFWISQMFRFAFLACGVILAAFIWLMRKASRQTSIVPPNEQQIPSCPMGSVTGGEGT